MVRPLPAGCRLTAIYDVSSSLLGFLAYAIRGHGRSDDLISVFLCGVVVPFGICAGCVFLFLKC